MSATPVRAPRETLTITQLCRQQGTTPRALRYYEQMGLLSPQRRNQIRIYSHREQVRLKLILQARRAGFMLREIRDLFDTYDKGGSDAQRGRALPLFRARLTALTRQRAEIDDALETLRAASDRMAVKLGPNPPAASDQSMRSSESVGRAAAPQSKRQPLRELVSLDRRTNA